MFIIKLLKIKVSSLIFYNCFAGYLISCSFVFDFKFFYLLFGLFFLVFFSSILNIYYEINLDKLMYRTKNRANDLYFLNYKLFIFLLFFFLFFSFFFFFLYYDFYSFFFCFFSFVFYIFLYTPLKNKNFLSYFIGAFSGSFPIIAGCLKNFSEIDCFCFFLFLFCYFWQFPHFFCISIFRKYEYLLVNYKIFSYYLNNNVICFLIFFSSFFIFILSILIFFLFNFGIFFFFFFFFFFFYIYIIFF